MTLLTDVSLQMLMLEASQKLSAEGRPSQGSQGCIGACYAEMLLADLALVSQVTCNEPGVLKQAGALSQHHQDEAGQASSVDSQGHDHICCCHDVVPYKEVVSRSVGQQEHKHVHNHVCLQ